MNGQIEISISRTLSEVRREKKDEDSRYEFFSIMISSPAFSRHRHYPSRMIRYFLLNKTNLRSPANTASNSVKIIQGVAYLPPTDKAIQRGISCWEHTQTDKREALGFLYWVSIHWLTFYAVCDERITVRSRPKRCAECSDQSSFRSSSQVSTCRFNIIESWQLHIINWPTDSYHRVIHSVISSSV